MSPLDLEADYPLGERIRWAIEERAGITQAEFARRIDTDPQTVNRWIRNPQKPAGKDSIQRVAEETGVSAAWLMFGEGEAPPQTVVEYKRPTSAPGIDLRAAEQVREYGKAINNSGEGSWPDPEPDDPEDVKQYLLFFGAEAEAFRRMAKRLPLSDIAKGCLDDAREEGMPNDHFTILYDRLAHLL